LPRGPTLLGLQHPTIIEEESTAALHAGPGGHDHAALAEPFRALHGPRLHGFALLVTLGDAKAAERAAGAALARGALRTSALRHPERAAAWLRAETLRAVRRRFSLPHRATEEERQAVLRPLGVDRRGYQGLAGLRLDARAALVASAIERFEEVDIETILGAGPSATRHVIAEARTRYLRAVADGPASEPRAVTPTIGPLARRVKAVATRAMAPEVRSR
jgi:hypothetical protein